MAKRGATFGGPLLSVSVVLLACGRTRPLDPRLVEADATVEDARVDDGLPDEPEVPPDVPVVDCVGSDPYVELVTDSTTLTYRAGCTPDAVPSWTFTHCCGEDVPARTAAVACEDRNTLIVVWDKYGAELVSSPLGIAPRAEVTITRDDRVLGGIVEGHYVATLTKTPTGVPVAVRGSFRVCRATVEDLADGS